MKPSARRATAVQKWIEVFGVAPAEPQNPLAEAALDFVCAEVWSRPGLARRDRRLLTLSCLSADVLQRPLRTMVHSCLRSGDITLDELHEIALHLAVFTGFPVVDAGLRSAVAETAGSLGLTARSPETADPSGARRSAGLRRHEVGAAPQAYPPLTAVLAGFAAAEVYSRPALSRRDRSLLSLAMVVRASLHDEMRNHAATALRLGDLTIAQLQEITLHLAAYLGFPRAANLQAAIDDIAPQEDARANSG